MECYCYLGNIQDLLSDGKTPNDRRFGEPFKGPNMPFGSMVEYHPISAKLRQDCTSLVRKFYLGYSSDTLCTRWGWWVGVGVGWERGEGVWKGDIFVADIGELERTNASEIHAKRLEAKEVITLKNGETFSYSRSQMEK